MANFLAVQQGLASRELPNDNIRYRRFLYNTHHFFVKIDRKTSKTVMLKTSEYVFELKLCIFSDISSVQLADRPKIDGSEA